MLINCFPKHVDKLYYFHFLGTPRRLTMLISIRHFILKHQTWLSHQLSQNIKRATNHTNFLKQCKWWPYIYAIWLICYRLSSKNDFHETLRRISLMLITFPRHKDQEGWSYQMTKTIFEISHGVIYQYQTLKTLRWMTIPDFQWHKGCPNNNIPETPRGMNVRIFV